MGDGKIVYPRETYDIPAGNIRLLGVHNHYNIAVAHFMTAAYVGRPCPAKKSRQPFTYTISIMKN